MKLKRMFGFLLALCTVLPLQSVQARPWTALDSVELSKISCWPEYSPDKKQFLVVTTRGVLSTNEIESTIWLFDTEKVRAICKGSDDKPSPRAILRLSACTYDEGGYPVTIHRIKWSKDGKHFYFLARGKMWERRLLSFDMASGKASQLSLPELDVASYELLDNTLVYLACKQPDPSTFFQAGPGAEAPEIVRGTGFSSTELMFPILTKFRYGLIPYRIYKLRLNQGNNTAQQSDSDLFTQSPLMSVSPDGRYAVVKAQVKKIPPAWTVYEPSSKDYSSFKADESEPSKENLKIKIHRPEQFFLADLATGNTRELVNAPLGENAGYYNDSVEAAWSPDGQKVALSNTFFPLTSNDASPIVRPCTVVADLTAGTVKCVQQNLKEKKDDLPVWAINWKDNSTLQIQGNSLSQSYEKDKDG